MLDFRGGFLATMDKSRKECPQYSCLSCFTGLEETLSFLLINVALTYWIEQAQLSCHHSQEAWWQFCSLGWVPCLSSLGHGSVDLSDPASKHTPHWRICSSPHYSRVASAWDPILLFTFLHLGFSKLILNQSALDEAIKWGTFCSLVTDMERTEIAYKRTFDATGKRISVFKGKTSLSYICILVFSRETDLIRHIFIYLI